ncbi:MAG: hypothetical protein ABL909_09505 [Sphingopyxis sp.]
MSTIDAVCHPLGDHQFGGDPNAARQHLKPVTARIQTAPQQGLCIV